MNRVYRVYDNQMPFLPAICKRDNFYYNVVGSGKDDNGNPYKVVSIPKVSPRRFRELIEDVMCEMESVMTNSIFPVYSYKTIHNQKKRKRLDLYYGTNAHFVYSKDCEREFRGVNI